MRNFNSVTISGYLGNDPESRNVNRNSRATQFSVAVSDRWNDDQGNPQERTNWIRVTAWNGLGDNIAKFLKKGSHVLVSGSLRENAWKDKKTQATRSRLEIVARDIIFLDPKPTDEAPPELPAEPGDEQGDVPL
jgi:single-strand DNA-binding protein